MTTSPPEVDAELERFDAGERVLHWVQAAVVLVLIATAAALYIGPISAAVARRNLIKDIHVVAGLGWPVPILATLVLPRWGRGLRADMRAVDRWTPADRAWLRSGGRRGRRQLGKFHPLQKLNAAFVAGTVPVMVGTGVVLRWPHPFPLRIRTGATFVHDWTALALGVAVMAHIALALGDRVALRGMVTGTVPRSWAETKAPAWAADHDA